MATLFSSAYTAIYLTGMFLALYAMWEILTSRRYKAQKRVILAFLVLITSWFGIALYFCWIRRRIK